MTLKNYTLSSSHHFQALLHSILSKAALLIVEKHNLGKIY